MPHMRECPTLTPRLRVFAVKGSRARKGAEKQDSHLQVAVA